jgi:hypothetical protein
MNISQSCGYPADSRPAAIGRSRSELLAHHALDLLSSRRMNLLRLQDGVGLPVRDILPDGTIGRLPTALAYYEEGSGRIISLNYADVCSRGVRRDEGQDGFNWIWRSEIKHYHRDAFYWRRWIGRMFEEQAEWNLLPSLIEADDQLSQQFSAESKRHQEIVDSGEIKSKGLEAFNSEIEGLDKFFEKLRVIYSALPD